MKWLAFTAAVIAVLIGLGVLAVDERDVIWEGRDAFCPYCRSEARSYAMACKECERTFDWVPHRENCEWCLASADVDILKDRFERLENEADPLPGELASFPRAYFLNIDQGSCTYCGGLGEVRNGTQEIACSVCRGRGTCIACNGDRVVIVGSERAHWVALERDRAWAVAVERSRLTGLPMLKDEIVDADVDALRGWREVENLEDSSGESLLSRARSRVEQAFRALTAEVARKAAETPAKTEGS
ncbi:MAG: DnaJ-like cysteine-rich domain-containing protein [Planctomycetota bacterium]|jgi:hypothetical protein